MKTQCLIMVGSLFILGSCSQGSSYDEAFDALLKYEGVVYHNNAHDPGGPTKYGWTLKTYRNKIDKTATVETIKNLTEAESKELYRLYWWEEYGASKIHDKSLAIALFLAQINLGASRPNRVLQKMTNDLCDAKLHEDGVLGSRSIRAVNQCHRLWPGYPYYLHLAYIQDKRIEPVWAWAKNGLRNRIFHDVQH